MNLIDIYTINKINNAHPIGCNPLLQCLFCNHDKSR